MEIREFAFSQAGLRSLREHSKGQNWPVVYLINNDKPNKSEYMLVRLQVPAEDFFNT